MVYDDFVVDYNNMDLTAHDVRRKHQLNSKQYSKIRNTALKNNDIPITRHMNQTDAKFYYKGVDGYYHVEKTINNTKQLIGTFADEKTAQKIVRLCKKENWNLNNIQECIDLNKIKTKNYSLVNGYYMIRKTVNGVNKVFLTVHQSKVDEETIKDVVDCFRSVNWNMNYRDEILEEFGL